ncbi:NAD(P)-binding protein [Pleurostoma richardsiae]|uniref:NAD(P)-binding protein n=1 Tax=Pleurostoma richardsiae TaxID=41990 RepID=A0AA38RHV9_9PEZI|nr:NAD(P)-binding protein [Pleurostoma richardsiae]
MAPPYTAPVTLKNPIIPTGSLVLVTGVNGLIASHIADVLLTSGYRVRGTVREPSKSAWVEEIFKSKYSADSFELVQVADLAAPGAWDKPIKGVSGAILVAGHASLDIADVDAAVKQELANHVSLLEAAKAEPTVKSVIYTASMWTAWTPAVGVAAKVDATSWNEDALRKVADPSLTPQQKGLAPFMATKTKVEQGLWGWVKREEPSYRFNTVHPDTVLGPIMNPESQPASTAGMVRWLWNGEHLDILEHVTPQWFIDARDCGRLFLGTLVTPGVEGERIFGCAERYSWPKVLEILKQSYPDKADFVDLPDAGWDQTDMANGRATELLRSLGQDEWTSLEQSVRDNVESFVKT